MKRNTGQERAHKDKPKYQILKFDRWEHKIGNYSCTSGSQKLVRRRYGKFSVGARVIVSAAKFYSEVAAKRRPYLNFAAI